jgi:hypothetical protein
MNENINTEINFYLQNIGLNIGGSEKIKIVSIMTKFINSAEYMEKVRNGLNSLLNDPSFNILTDFSEILKILMKVNSECDFYKTVDKARLKYVCYAVLYATIIKNNIDILNNISISDFRLLYVNSMDLLFINSDELVVNKESCINCIGRSFSIFKWMVGKTKI